MKGAIVFRHACKMGLEDIVSKRQTAPYRSWPSRDSRSRIRISADAEADRAIRLVTSPAGADCIAHA